MAALLRRAPRLARRAAPRTFASDAYLGSDLETSTLPNGVVVTTTAPGAPLTCVGVGVGRGASHGPRSAALAASLNSFKTANGRTDLRIQRDLEVAGSMPYSSFDAHQTTTVCTQHVVTREAPCVAEAFQAAALAAQMGQMQQEAGAKGGDSAKPELPLSELTQAAKDGLASGRQVAVKKSL